MKLTITRHGETEENKKKIIMGHIPGTLSTRGKAQAKKLAKRLEKEKFDYIFSSDLARAADTAKEVAKFHKKVPLDFTKELRERFLGEMEGKATSQEWKEGKWDHEFSKKLNLETPEDTLKRAQNFLENLTKNHYGKNVLLIAHNGINRALITFLLGKTWKEIEESDLFGNTSITIFEFDKNKNPVLKLMNCMKHLEE